MPKRKAGVAQNRQGHGSAAGVQDMIHFRAYHELAKAPECFFQNLSVELVEIIAHQCRSLRDQAALAQASKWLDMIVSPFVYKTVWADHGWSILFWAAEHGRTDTLKKLDIGYQQYHASDHKTCNQECTSRCINWNMYSQETFTNSHLLDRYIRRLRYIGETDQSLPLYYTKAWVHAQSFPMPYRFLTYTPLHLAVHNGSLDTVRFLLDRGADIEAVSCGIGLGSLRYSQLLNNDFDSFWITDIAVTPLVIAAYNCDSNTAELLLQRGASVQLRKLRPHNENAVTTLTILHIIGNMKPTKIASREMAGLIKMLVQGKHVPVDVPDDTGLTPLARAAAIEGGLPVLQVLKALGANVNYTIPAGRNRPAQSILAAYFTRQISCRDYWSAARRLVLLGADVEAGDGQPSMLTQCQSLGRRNLSYRKQRELDELVACLVDRYLDAFPSRKRGRTTSTGAARKGKEAPKRTMEEEDEAAAGARPTLRRSKRLNQERE